MASRVVFFDQKIGGIGYLKERGYNVEGVIMGFKLFERAAGKIMKLKSLLSFQLLFPTTRRPLLLSLKNCFASSPKNRS